MSPGEFMCTMCPQRPERASGPLEQALHWGNRQVGAGNRTLLLCKSSQPPRHLPSPDTHTHFLTLTEKTSDPLLSPGAGLVPLGLHRSAPPSPDSRIPAIHQRATEAPMQNQTGEKEDGASHADPESRHPGGPGGKGRQTPKPRLGR